MYGVDDRNQITIRSAGRRVKPSQPEAAAKDAGPVPAMAGVLLPMQQPHVKAAKPVAPATEQVCSDAVTQATRTYTVRAGGTLSSTAERFSGNAVGRHWIYAANQSKIANPDLILATCDPEGTAKAAVIISGVGTSWTRWTTFVSGAYEGQC
jgi:nucleoid-associated protein YgaU